MLLMLLSVTGLAKTILLIVAVMVILRFIGKIMNGRRHAAAHNQHLRQKEAFKQAKEASKKNIGKVSIKKDAVQAEDVDFEEID